MISWFSKVHTSFIISIFAFQDKDSVFSEKPAHKYTRSHMAEDQNKKLYKFEIPTAQIM
jgi:hypothetical protein